MRLIAILLKFCCCWISMCQAVMIRVQPIVNIPNLGQLRGSQTRTASGRKFYAFRGVPYAQPPVGELRFRDPVPVKPWTGVLSATRERSSCIQYFCYFASVIGNEDCLILNVYTPTLTDTALLPVMVWIHGGGFGGGSGNSESSITDVSGPGPGYILNRNVVLVTINYRLGVLGFLSTEDAEAPGNYGLLDQSLALKWVRDNIRYFGGNPDSVTLFGQSAGGASVEFQMLSPHSKGLFHRAISQSGSTRCPWALQNTVGDYTKALAKDLNCPTSDSRQLVDCLRSKRAKQLVMNRKTMLLKFGLCMYPIAFGPRIDKERNSPFLPDNPEQLLTLGQFNPVPFIFGLNENEGGLFAASLVTFPGVAMKAFKRDQVNSVRYTMGMQKRLDGYEIAQKAYHHYFIGNTKRSCNIPDQYADLTSDFSFFKCVDESAKLWSKYSASPTYYYQYAYRHRLDYADITQFPNQIDFGVVHGDELMMMFTNKASPIIKQPNDIKVSNTLIDLWTSFATDGVPKSNLILGEWLPNTEGQARHLRINVDKSQLINDSMPFESNLAFWNQLLDSSSKRIEL